MYWLQMSEDGGVRYPSHSEIDSAMNDAQSMGATVVRSHAVLSVGGPLCIEPSLGVYNAGAWESIDYAIRAASSRGIRLVLPLVDNYTYFQGGKFTYLAWRGIPADSVGSQFFTDPAVLADFKDHISHVINHVNQYTGIRYRDDPTIMVWETGNELSVYPNPWNYAGWTRSVADYIKSIDPNHLVMDGKYGIYSIGGTVDTASLQIGSVDVYSNHAYDNYRTPGELALEAATVASYGKAFLIGEFSWTDKAVGGAPLSWTLGQLIAMVEATPTIAGDLYWELLPSWVAHNDGFTLHWPGDNADMVTRAGQLKNHALTMRG